MTLMIMLMSLIMSFLPMMVSTLSLGIWIIMLALMISMTMSFITSSWFSYIVFLIYIGGLLVMFAYFVAIDPNKKIKMMDPIFIPTTITIVFLFMSTNMWVMPIISHQKNTHPTILTLLSMQFFPILMLMALSLLLILISVVKITNRKLGTLRPYMSYV